MDHDYSDAFVVKIVGEQLSDHVLGGFASMMSIISTALLLCSQLDGSPFGTDENKFRARRQEVRFPPVAKLQLEVRYQANDVQTDR